MQVFADNESSQNPIDVPRSWLWNLPRRTVYFGTSVSTIFKGKRIFIYKYLLHSYPYLNKKQAYRKCLSGLSTEGIQYCFWKGMEF